MKLSEAIMLGSTTVKMEAGDWNSCALGAACNAMGVRRHDETRLWGAGLSWDKATASINVSLSRGAFDRSEQVLLLWPWLSERPHSYFESVFTCRNGGCPCGYLIPCHNWLQLVYICFDNLVVNGHMTLEQLVDYVASVEPSCGECNSFVCCCVKDGHNVYAEYFAVIANASDAFEELKAVAV